MTTQLLRVGTTYLPVQQVKDSAEWYASKLGAKLNYIDEDKAILDLANQSFFLVAAQNSERANFIKRNGNEHFSMTFEVDGLEALKELHQQLKESGVKVGNIEDRGHTGNNFVFEDNNSNQFDVWSELSPSFKINKR
ncbi:VOC family protein [Thalassobacillus hwangdonensis]|uniref:VOC family protein n=1 Tax=Thalassobacillus hwangdonensis TaxID=546108 RepID=A0ABW3L002_9BACI